MNVKINAKDIVGKVGPNGIIIQNYFELYLGQVGPKKRVPHLVLIRHLVVNLLHQLKLFLSEVTKKI
jgi:hypothetical protein